VGSGVQRRAHHLSENMIEVVGTPRFAHPDAAALHHHL
jgi:hypothetical protein